MIIIRNPKSPPMNSGSPIRAVQGNGKQIRKRPRPQIADTMASFSSGDPTQYRRSKMNNATANPMMNSPTSCSVDGAAGRRAISWSCGAVQLLAGALRWRARLTAAGGRSMVHGGDAHDPLPTDERLTRGDEPRTRGRVAEIFSDNRVRCTPFPRPTEDVRRTPNILFV
jgi:hypothetical protein